jgi:hypothetical protein
MSPFSPNIGENQKSTQRRRSLTIGTRIRSNYSLRNKSPERSPHKKKRHNSEGISNPALFDDSLLHYTKIKTEDGPHYCDGKKFFLQKEFPQTGMEEKKDILNEIKRNLLSVTPAITPGQRHLSHTDLVWDMAEMKSAEETSSGCHLKRL